MRTLTLRAIRLAALAFGLFDFVSVSARADILFADNFDAGASSAWSNSSGDWTTRDATRSGVYFAQNPDNDPNAHSFVSTLPHLSNNFSVTVDIANPSDGGIWLQASEGGAIGAKGVLLVFLNGGGAQGLTNALFWEVATDGGYTGPPPDKMGTVLNAYNGSFSLKVTVQGDLYSAYVNGSTTPATTLVDHTFHSGYVGVYDDNGSGGQEGEFRDQSFDNFVVTRPDAFPGDAASVPGPVVGAGLPGLLVGFGAMLEWCRKRRRFI